MSEENKHSAEKTGGKGKIDTYNQSLTRAERVAAASKAGKASGEVRREKGFVRRALLAGLDDKTLADIRAAMLAKAKKGDTAMIDLLFKTIGESGQDALKVDVGDNTANLLCNMTTADKIARLQQLKKD